MDLHPEHLIERARRGELSEQDKEVLRQHVSHCGACRLLLGAGKDFDELPVDSAEVARVEALVEGAMTALKGRRGVRGPARWLTAAVVLLAFGGLASAAVAAIVWFGKEGRGPQSSRTPSVDVRRQLPDAPTEEPGTNAVHTVETDAPAPGDEVAVPPRRAPRIREAARRDRSPVLPPSASAGELLSQANAARRTRAYPEAVRLYQTLQRLFPTSRETRVSRIALGRLFLDQRGDPAAALVQFDAYLGGGEGGALAAEARVGRAVALGRLSRSAEERAAWEAVLRHDPGSVYAEQARSRIEALGTGP